MNWVYLTLLAILFRAIYGIATKVLSTNVKVSPISQSVILTGFATLLSLVLSPFLGGFSFSHISSVWPATILMVASSTLGNIVYFKGQEKLDAGTTQIAFSSIVIWGALLSFIFLGSHFSFLQVFGILLLLSAIILIQYKKSHYQLSSAVLYIIASAFIFSIFQVSSAQVSRALPAGTALPIEYIGSTLLVVLCYPTKILRELRSIQKNGLQVVSSGFFASGSTLLYFLFSYLAYAAAPDRGIVVILLTTQVIVAVMLGIIFLKEREGMKRKLFAAVLAVAASILIKI